MQVIKYVGYVRVSSVSQKDNNSFETQKKDILNFIGKHELVEIIEEVKSGAKADRKGIMQAIELCKASGYTLLVSKVDRLSRELSLIEIIRNSGIKFVFANMPNANELTIDMLLAFAKHERKEIVARTTAGKKATILKFGTLHHIKGTAQNMTAEKQQKAVASIKAKAEENTNNMQAKSKVKDMLAMGKTFAEILTALQKNKFLTSKGKPFTQIIQVQRLAK